MSLAMFYVVISCTFFSVGITLWNKGRSKIKQFRKKAVPWERTTAVVTGVSSQFFGKGRSYFPMYRYTYEGRQYSWTSSIGRREGTHKVGEIIEILVNPLNPSESEVAVDLKLGSHNFLVSDFIAGKPMEGMLILGIAILFFAVGAVLAGLAVINWR